MQSRIVSIDPLNQEENNNFRKWLEEQNNEMKTTTFEIKEREIDKFPIYYAVNASDIDIELNDRITADSIVFSKENLFDYFKTQEDLIDLDKMIEKYRKHNVNTWLTNRNNEADKINRKVFKNSRIENNINILIKQDTNRYQVNNIFKNMIDVCDETNMICSIPNINDICEGRYIKSDIYKLINPDFKEEFYKFCYNNS